MDVTHEVLRRLSDGSLKSGSKLAREFGLSRTAVWKHVQTLAAYGLNVVVERGRGYRLSEPVELLDSRAIAAAIPAAGRKRVSAIDSFLAVDSTNRHLLACASPDGHAVLAEFQTAGRGRRGNIWRSPIGSGICLSFGWRFDTVPSSLTMLSLLAGVAALRALRRCGIDGVGLKWPNDLVHGSRKLGGILIESRGQLAGPHDVVVGIGLNVQLPGGFDKVQDQAVTDLASVAGERPSRVALAGAILGQFVILLEACARETVQDYLEEWRRHDVMRGREARLRLKEGDIVGRVVDIDGNGMLLLSVDGEIRRYGSGELSLRLA